jgi:hypothetical protein
MKGYNLMKRYLIRKNKPRDAANIKEDGAIMIIIDGITALPLRHKHKRILQEIYHTKLAVPSYLRWSEIAVTYDRTNHPDHIPHPRAYPLVVALLFGTKRVHKVLMDGGSSLNIVYMSTLNSMGI